MDEPVSVSTALHEPVPTPEALPVASAVTVSPQMLALASFIVAAIFLVFAYYSRRRASSRGNALLVVGPPDSGKTALLSLLVFKQALPTQTSMQINQSVLTLPQHAPLTVVDVPGHPRIRGQFKEHMLDARTIIFVVDASTVSRNAPAVAEHLHHILNAVTSLPPSHTAPSLLILAHKADLLKPSAGQTSAQLAVTRVRTVLERELERRRNAQAGAVNMDALPGGEDEGEGEGGVGMGGLECSGPSGGVFKFAEWEGGEVAFEGSWVKLWERLHVEGEDEKAGGGEGVQAVIDWIEAVP